MKDSLEKCNMIYLKRLRSERDNIDNRGAETCLEDEGMPRKWIWIPRKLRIQLRKCEVELTHKTESER